MAELEHLSERIELTTTANEAGERLDRYVAGHCGELSRARVQDLIEAGLVQVNGRETKASYKLRGGEHVTVQAQPRAALHAEAESIPLDVLYEDEDLIVLNKPAGMTVHAGAGNSRGTLVNALLGRGQSLSRGGGALRPGIVHRLDKDTSGAIVVAKNDFAHTRLAEAFRKREVKKTYLALIQGALSSERGCIELSIGRDPRRRMRMTAKKSGAAGKTREARTDWRALATIANHTLVEIQLHTGRTHQIRVHFSAIKHPVVGDTLYGAGSQIRVGKNTLPALHRQFLHAAKVAFLHPRTGEPIEVRAPLAPELGDFLKKLAAATGDAKQSAKIDAALAPYL
jgi:23S rRNA pseudouridine1911/1915/1917 synthase